MTKVAITCLVIGLSVSMAGSPTISPTVLAAAAEGSFRVQQVVDGDTVVLHDGRYLRYLGINAPERGEPFCDEAKSLNARFVHEREVALEFEEVTHDGYGRLLAYVQVDGTMVNAELLAAGFVHIFLLEPIRYYEQFRSIQEQARAKRRGVWGRGGFKGPLKITRLKADAEGDDRHNLNDEYVRVCNVSSDDVDLQGFVLSDRHRHRYTFPSAVLRPGYTALLFTGKGRNVVKGAHQLRFFWGSDYPIWNNKGDTAFLRTPGGELIDSFAHIRRAQRK